MALSVMTLPAASAVPATDPPLAPLTEGQKALAQASESGERVEVVGERSEQTTVFANPDGFSFTLEESSVPVRVTDPEGGWRSPDATLVRRADGSVGPKAAAVAMSFSDGGKDEPLARIAEQGHALALSWADQLPEPVLDGASAVYPNLLPGVDLKVTATTESFRHVLVVKTPEAAALPELKELTFGLKTEGLTVREGAAGNLAAVDGNGNTVFKAPPAQMWNSAGKQQTPTAPSGTTTASRGTATQFGSMAAVTEGEQPVPGDPSEKAPSGTGIAPGQGDEVARMEVAVDKDSLSVTPDTGLLTSTAPEAFPIFIDPTVSWSESERTLLRSDGYESYGWDNGDDDRGMGAGKCGTWNGYYCGPGYVQRLYFEFSPASLKGKHVLDATFRVTEPWAFQCDPRWVELVRTNNISSATTWSSRPAEIDWMVDRNVSAGRGSLCDPDSPDAPIEFNDNLPDEPNENLTATIRDFAAGKFSRLTLEIRAQDESDTSAWKRFKNDAVLAVDFVGLPDKPTSVGIVTGSGTTCETTESDPAVVSDPTPDLRATPQTKSGGEQGSQLRVYFDVDHKNADGSWSDTPTAGDRRPSTGYVGDGVPLVMAWSPALLEGKLYRYKAYVESYYNNGSSRLSGPVSSYCYFKVDPTAPKAPIIGIHSPYAACTPNDCPSNGGPGVKATFSFKPAEGDTGNVAYQYKLSSPAAWTAATKVCTPGISDMHCLKLPLSSPDVKMQGTFTPARAATYRLYVRAQDEVGRWGAQNVVDFLVAPGAGPVGRWHFDEAEGPAKSSAGATAHDATLAGGAGRDDRGRRGLITHDAQGNPLTTAVTDRGLTLNGTTGYAGTVGPVLEARASFTVSAWVRVDPSSTRTVNVISQTPQTTGPWTKKYSPFALTYGGKWSMRVHSTDGTFIREAMAPQTSPKGVWTHVAGVHDAANKKMHLYVNGKLEASADAGTTWNADGPLQFGRLMYGDVLTDYMNGSIDEVAVWQVPLTSSQIADEARLKTSEHFADVELVADWSADAGGGTSVADPTSGYGRTLTLTGGTTIGNGEIVFDGVDDAAGAAGPVVDDTGSFTVTTLATLNSAKLLTKEVGYTGQVLGQRTADGSAWGFWFQLTGTETVLNDDFEERTVPVGFWHFGRLNTDGTFTSVRSTESAVLDSAVRLTGVFDAHDGSVRLYLGGLRDGEPKEFAAKAGSGDFAIGRGFTSGAWKHYMPQRISEVRMWAGAMASETQVGLAVGD
ncbi:LamG domain-containing protein [Streptomyces pristinaespiralis]|uniref:LamG domain-containing protein n=1 Tax=Streptomyces pristinaespiralis TaxID=38300 RepID=UPI003F4CE68D